MLFLGLFLRVCNLAIVNAADAGAAPHPAPAAVSRCRFVLYSYTLFQSQHTTVTGKDKYQWPLSVEYLSDELGLLLFLYISLAFLVFVLIN